MTKDLSKNMREENLLTDKNGHKIIRTISPNDEMYLYAGNDDDNYFSVSASAIHCIDLALRHANKNDIRSILDLPCGHGRVLRSIVSYYPKARIVACDLDRDGVDFCVGTFGVEGVYSDKDPTRILMEERFDIIWCGSLLSRLSAENSRAFLNFFIKHLEKDGILVASLQGRCALAQNIISESTPPISDIFHPILEGYNESGFGFTASDIKEGYGISATKISWLAKYVEEQPDIRLLYFSEGLFSEHQDVFAIQKKSFEEIGSVNVPWQAHEILHPLPALTTSAKATFDEFRIVMPGCFSVRGWGVLEGINSLANQKYIVLKGANGTYFFPTKDNTRSDITEHFGNANHDNSGFDALMISTGMSPGTYQAGVLIINDDKAGVAYCPGVTCVVK